MKTYLVEYKDIHGKPQCCTVEAHEYESYDGCITFKRIESIDSDGYKNREEICSFRDWYLVKEVEVNK